MKKTFTVVLTTLFSAMVDIKKILFSLLFILTPQFVIAATSSHSATSLVVRESGEQNNPFANEIESNILRLIALVEKNADTFSKQPDTFYESLDTELSRSIDFDRFTSRVTVRHSESITPEQQKQFTNQIKRTLFNAYIRGFANPDDLKNIAKNLTIETAKDLRYTNEAKTRAFQDLKITKNNKTFNVTFSLFKNAQNNWMIENVIAEGINLGLNYRSQFETLMEKYNDMNKVLDNWSGYVATEATPQTKIPAKK